MVPPQQPPQVIAEPLQESDVYKTAYETQSYNPPAAASSKLRFDDEEEEQYVPESTQPAYNGGGYQPYTEQPVEIDTTKQSSNYGGYSDAYQPQYEEPTYTPSYAAAEEPLPASESKATA